MGQNDILDEDFDSLTGTEMDDIIGSLGTAGGEG